MQATANTLTIVYSSAVKVEAGWRDVKIKARAEKISAGMAVVREVVEIDGETPAYGQSRTGAKRQSFNGKAWAAQQIGAKKRLSACTVAA
jgi:hypothetical protein